jgi:hypothetical protein
VLLELWQAALPHGTHFSEMYFPHISISLHLGGGGPDNESLHTHVKRAQIFIQTRKKGVNMYIHM